MITFAHVMTYQEIIGQLGTIYEAGEARAITRLLLEQRFGLSMADILCGKVNELSADDQQELQKIVRRLLRSEPIQYVLGETTFCGRSLHVAPGVLIPRPETEELCQWIINDNEHPKKTNHQHPSPITQHPRILDIGTGSGCIAITLAAEIKDSRVTAWDISDAALEIARENAEKVHVNVTFEKKDVLKAAALAATESPLATEEWDIIVSNPPYIYRKESELMARNVLDYEPHEALFAPDDDPEAMYKAIGRYAAATLLPGGSLYLEMNPLLTEEVAAYLQEIGLGQVEMRHDQFGKLRMIKATKTNTTI